jgi:RNA polymerase sigma factor for flagellar operon FliA
MLTTKDRSELIIKSMPFADRIAANQFRKTPRCVQLDELKSAAYMGLVDAANKYDGNKPFEIYAPFRIYGAIKDYLRELNWAGRGQEVKVCSSNYEGFDYAEESDPEDFREVFDFVTKSVTAVARKALWYYYAEDKTLKEIGELLSLSVTRVYQIIQGGLQKIRLDENVTNR